MPPFVMIDLVPSALISCRARQSINRNSFVGYGTARSSEGGSISLSLRFIPSDSECGIVYRLLEVDHNVPLAWSAEPCPRFLRAVELSSFGLIPSNCDNRL